MCGDIIIKDESEEGMQVGNELVVKGKELIGYDIRKSIRKMIL